MVPFLSSHCWAGRDFWHRHVVRQTVRNHILTLPLTINSWDFSSQVNTNFVFILLLKLLGVFLYQVSISNQQLFLEPNYIENPILCAVTHLTLSSLMQCVEYDFRTRVILLNSFIWKYISLQTDLQIIHKYKHLQKNQASFHGRRRNDALAPEKCCVMRGDAKAVWHISVEFITHTKWNQFYSTVTLTFTEKWNGSLEMKTLCEISTKNLKFILSFCHYFLKIGHVL